jgi:putative membrane protein
MVDQDDKQTIERAVAEAEAKTSTEIVVMVMGSATDYRGIEFLAAAIAALAVPAFLLPFTFIPALNIWIVQLLAFVVLVIAARAMGLGRIIRGKSSVAEDVRAVAEAQFFAHGLRRTRKRAAVLIFAALQEHRVEILCDDAATEAVPQDEWDRLASRLAEHLAAKNLEKGLSETAHRTAELLAPHFPPDGDDTDELPNVIVH